MMKRVLIILSLLAIMAVSVGMVAAQGPGGRGGRGGRGHHHGSHLIETIAEALEMEPEDIIEALQAEEGTTLADVIEANGGDVEAIIAAVVEEKTERLNEAVADGRLTQEEADERLAELEERITERLNSEFTPRGRRAPSTEDVPEEESSDTTDDESTNA
ncbi:MAG: hypothetical protein L0154_08445 [Chloroflexi bacterium]|nr:hypothetical protein [Chloroflexota bacterium]